MWSSIGKRDGGGALIAVLRHLSPHSFGLTPSKELLKRCELVAITIPSATESKRHLISGVYMPDSRPHATYELLFKELLEIIKDPDIHFFLY